jgi:hypothetical protein
MNILKSQHLLTFLLRMRLLLYFNIVILNVKQFNNLSVLCGAAEVVTDDGSLWAETRLTQ